MGEGRGEAGGEAGGGRGGLEIMVRGSFAFSMTSFGESSAIEARHSGWLYKKGEINPAFKHRFFVMDEEVEKGLQKRWLWKKTSTAGPQQGYRSEYPQRPDSSQHGGENVSMTTTHLELCLAFRQVFLRNRNS